MERSILSSSKNETRQQKKKMAIQITAGEGGGEKRRRGNWRGIYRRFCTFIIVYKYFLHELLGIALDCRHKDLTTEYYAGRFYVIIKGRWQNFLSGHDEFIMMS